MARTTAKRQAYHHGELADELMTRALRHIEAEGTEKLSLRALAREAGVSQTAPYRHFPTKRCLLAALATRGFTQLRTDIRAATATDEPVAERFIAMGCAYVQFAVDNPTTYELMFGSVLGDFSDYDMLHNAAGDSYRCVLSVLEELIAANQLDADLSHLGGVVWSAVHGMASLLLNVNSKQAHDRARITGGLSAPAQSLVAVHNDLDKSLRLLFSNLLS